MQTDVKSHKNARHTSKKRYLRWFVALAGLGIATAIGAVAGTIGAYYYVAPALPAAETIRDIPLQIPLRIFSRDGHLIEEIGERKRILITYDDVPEHVVNAFVAAEDKRFWVHPGVDYRGLLRAFFQLITTGNVEAGGSTLTQQLARSYFLSLDRTVERKFKEASLAVRIENEFTKQQIMALFLNKMFFGQRAYGVAASAQVYFDKALKDLDISEAATLAGVLPAPSRYNPVRSVEEAAKRRNYVLGRMLDIGYIDRNEYDEAMSVAIEGRMHGAAVELNAPYVAEMVRRDMESRYGQSYSTDGYQVVTTLDSRMQRAANYAVRNGLLEFTRRRGYKGPLAQFDITPEILATPFDDWPVEIRQSLEQYAPGNLTVALVVETSEADNSARVVARDGAELTLPWQGMSWAKPFVDLATTGAAPESVADVVAPGDVILVMPTTAGTWALAQVPGAQSALVAMDPSDGAISSLVGGFDFATSKYNRVTQAFRQPGSAFKPFIYSAALEHGNTLATVILDAPIVISSSELEAVWRPINYSGRFYGPTRLREALYRSMNLVSVRLLLFETGFGNAINHIAKFGFGDAALIRNGSLALGGGNASPLDMVQGYSVFANGGYSVKPYAIDAIYGPEGETLYRAEPAVVCEPCVAEPDDDFVVEYDEDGNPIDRFPLEQMADIALEFQPDAAIAPELFEQVNVAPRVISAQNAFLIQDVMRDVVRRGTGRRALALGRRDLSGKTGTSNDQRDAWFGGFQGDMAAIVWVGYDDSLPLGPGEEGSRTALPIWIEYMRIALRGVPENQMAMPEGIASVRIDPKTGCPARAGQRNTIFEYFREGHIPVCDDVEELPTIFNDPGPTDEAEEEEPESLF